jgi:hypothetical protein
VIGPITEEITKGVILLVLVLAVRRQFNSPVDAVVYAAWAAAGFAFIENMGYFGKVLGSSSESGIGSVFFLRGVMSPFMHPMATTCIGIGVGVALSIRPSFPAALLGWVIGIIPAIFLHGLWNWSASQGVGFFLLYVVVQIPLFCVMVGLMFWLRAFERQTAQRNLAPFVSTGWLNPGEIHALASGAGRRRSRGWASSVGRRPQMLAYFHAANQLAFTWRRVNQRPEPGALERALNDFATARARALT